MPDTDTATTPDLDLTKARYPWDDWTDGTLKALAVRGEDEMAAMESVNRVRNSIYVYAKRHDLSVRTLLDHKEDHIMLRFQLLPKSGDEGAFSDVFSTGTMHGIEVLSLDETGTPVS